VLVFLVRRHRNKGKPKWISDILVQSGRISVTETFHTTHACVLLTKAVLWIQWLRISGIRSAIRLRGHISRLINCQFYFMFCVLVDIYVCYQQSKWNLCEVKPKIVQQIEKALNKHICGWKTLSFKTNPRAFWLSCFWNYLQVTWMISATFGLCATETNENVSLWFIGVVAYRGGAGLGF
jgi:hypothetical protein